MTKPWDDRTKCSDCGIVAGYKPGTMQAFYLHDELWNSIADTHDVLCFDCTEKRLGRPITLDDLKDCALTRCMLLGVRVYNQTPRKS